MRKICPKAISAVTTGMAHLDSGSPCQDVAAHYKLDHTMGVSLCDGAGSASHSQIGAEITSSYVAKILVEEFETAWKSPSEFTSRILDGLSNQLESAAKREVVPIQQLACTLLFSGIQIRRKQIRYVCGNLGDGIVVMRSKDTLHICLGPENQEFANQTWFVTSPDAADHLRVSTGSIAADQIPGWLLSTDGAAPLLHSKRSGRFAPAVMSLLEDLRTKKPSKVQAIAQSFLRDTLAPKTHDDCSVALLQIAARSGNVQRAAK